MSHLHTVHGDFPYLSGLAWTLCEYLPLCLSYWGPLFGPFRPPLIQQVVPVHLCVVLNTNHSGAFYLWFKIQTQLCDLSAVLSLKAIVWSYKPSLTFRVLYISMHLLLWINVMPDFICMGFAKLWGNRKQAKNSKWKYMSQQEMEPVTPHFPTSALDHLANQAYWLEARTNKYTTFPAIYTNPHCKLQWNKNVVLCQVSVKWNNHLGIGIPELRYHAEHHSAFNSSSKWIL